MQHIEFHVNQLHYKHFFFQGSETMSDVYDIVKGALNVEAGKPVYISSVKGDLSISREVHDQRGVEGQRSVHAENVTALIGKEKVDSFSISW